MSKTRSAVELALILIVLVGVAFFTKPAWPQTQGGGFAFIPLGFCTQSVTSGAAVGFGTCSGGIPAGAKYAFVRVEQNMRWRDDGTAPTSSTGQIINSTDVQGLWYSARLSAIQFIAVSTSGALNITFYGGQP